MDEAGEALHCENCQPMKAEPERGTPLPTTAQLGLQNHLETQLHRLASAFPTGPSRGLKLLVGTTGPFMVTSSYPQLQASVPPEVSADSP